MTSLSLRSLGLSLGLLVACSEKSATDSVGSADSAPSIWTPPEGGVVELQTRDDVTLVADYYPAENAGAPAIVLLHMIPPSNDRSTWPVSFISELSAQGWSVLVLDRRGAGDSEGQARDAYEGEYGRYDVEAAALRLQADGAGGLGIIGASNGTTSLVDYAVWAGAEGLPQVVVAGFMTGGTYTETQNDMDRFAALDVPAVFTYSTEERAWSEEQRARDPGSWSFLEYTNGDHGTRMFDVAPEVSADLRGFLSGVL